MEWKNARQDEVPGDGETILVSVDGVYYLTVYDANEKKFRLKDQPETYFTSENTMIYWTEFNNPDDLPTKRS